MAVQVAPVDPNVRLPAAVVAATQRAVAMQEEMRKAQQGEQPAPEAPPADGASQAPSPPPNPPLVEPDLEHKLKSAEGRLAKAERERQALAARLAALEAQRPAPQQQQPRRPEPEIQVQRLVTQEEEDEYGTDFLGVVGRRAREELASELFKIQRQINDLGGSVGRVNTAVATDAREKMKSDLDAVLPQWRDINYDDRFISWLALQDPLSGAIRHELLKSAYSGNQTHRVLNFFKAYLAEEAAGSPPSPGNGAAPNPTNGAAPARIPLETLAAPGRASPAATPVPADKQIITRAQITQFYADVAAGKYRGREAEKLENDAAIVLAGNEGRIV
jgi:hypothetical protein